MGEMEHNEALNLGMPFLKRDIALAEIAANLRYWLRFDENSRAQEGLSVEPDNHIIPPHWPTRRQLELWCYYLELPND